MFVCSAWHHVFLLWAIGGRSRRDEETTSIHGVERSDAFQIKFIDYYRQKIGNRMTQIAAVRPTSLTSRMFRPLVRDLAESRDATTRNISEFGAYQAYRGEQCEPVEVLEAWGLGVIRERGWVRY